MQALITFHSTSHAIRAEQVLLAEAVDVRVMPLPAALQSGCGIVLRLPLPAYTQAKQFLADAGVQMGAAYVKSDKNGKTTYQPWEEYERMQQPFSILSACTSGGCGAKIGPGELAGVLKNLPPPGDDRLLVGFDAADDAAVYQLDENTAVISTVDFFSPMVEDPRTFGRIAAANALSDVYAMGGTPVLALNLVCFPESLPKTVLGEILAGGQEKIREAGAVLGGGHSIYDKEPKYGLAVTGTVPPGQIIRNNTPKVGDSLILTKPLGVGIIMAAARGQAANDAAVQKAVDSMQRLNRYAAEKMRQYPVNACTDITGFGLLAHLLEMCGETCTAQIDADALPVIPEAAAYADEYLLTAAGQRNRNYFGTSGDVSPLPFALQELMFDPQTSGGLLISVEAGHAPALLADIQKDDPHARIIGGIIQPGAQKVLFT